MNRDKTYIGSYMQGGNNLFGVKVACSGSSKPFHNHRFASEPGS